MNAPCRLHLQSPRRLARGAGALATVVLLMLVATLATLGLGRALWSEQRSLAAQVRGTQAQEAAQFGLDRAWARLHEPRPLTDDCRQATGAVTGDRLEALLQATSSTPQPLLACTRSAADWDCRCPPDAAVAAGPAALTGLDTRGEGVWVVATPLDVARPDAGLRLTALACSEGGAACAREAAAGATASAAAQTVLDLAPRVALASTPAAAVVAGGAIRVASPAGDRVRIVNRDPQSHGLVVQAGGGVHVDAGHLEGLPGAPRAWAVVEGDTHLAAGPADRRLAAWLGVEPGRWAAWPRVARVPCHGGCTAEAVEAALRDGYRAVHVAGDLRWSAPRAPDQPFVLVVAGNLRVEGAGRIDAVILAHDVQVVATDPVTPLEVHGALLAAGDVEIAGTSIIVRSADVIEAARMRPVALGRLPGGWRDLPVP